MSKKTLIIGASTNPERYAYKAAEKLLAYKHEIYMLGIKPGVLFGQEIVTELVNYDDVDTITIYVSKKNQPAYYEYILSLKPRRVIFNPDTENSEFEKKLEEQGIIIEQASTLVLLAIKIY